jgi:hypothetical protein
MSNLNKEQSYYCIIPWKILTNKKLSSTTKLIYGEILALTNKDGYCRASNKHFAKIFEIKNISTISSLINKLAKLEYIFIEIDKKNGNKRKIWITTPIRKNHNRYYEKSQEGIRKNHNKEYNIESNNKINNIYTHFCKRFNKNSNQYRLTTKRINKIRTRLKEFKVDEILQAITNASEDDFYSGKNDRGWTADLDYITRSYEIVERLLHLQPRKAEPNNSYKGKYDDIIEN